jgi:hypothetical protein
VDITELTVGDNATCAATGTPASAPCTASVKGLTLEQPPAQPANLGGGLHSTLTLELSEPLANNQSVNVQFLLGVMKTGLFRFYVVIEALP